MNNTVPALVVAAVLALALVGMGVGWRNRRRRQAAMPRPLPIPADTGRLLASVEALHVATTAAGEPLNRIAVAGLGFRARGTLGVAQRGVLIALDGRVDAYLPAADILTVERATWTIDRVVEPGGLLVIGWSLGGTPVDSYFRLAEGAAMPTVIDALQSLLPVAAAAQEGQTR